MSLVVYLTQKCLQKMDENVALIVKKFSDPGKLIDANASGALVEAAQGGMGALATLAEEYLRQNSDALLFAALKATGLEKKMEEAFKGFQDLLAAALMAQNNLVYRMTKEIAWSLMEELSKKDKLLIHLGEKVKELYSALASLVGAPDSWSAYRQYLEQALQLVAGTRADLQLVYNTLSRNGYWLNKRFDGTITKLEKARDLITPKDNNPAIQKISEGSYKINQALGTVLPDASRDKKALAEGRDQAKARAGIVNKGFQTMGQGLAIFGEGLSDNFPIPTTSQGWQATVAIGKLSNDVLIAMQGYFGHTNKVNALVESFKLSLGALNTAMPSFLKNYILNRLQPTYNRVDTLVHSMAKVLNGDQDAITGPIAGYKPNSVQLTVNGFKWISDINLILQGYKSIPKSALDKMALDQDAANEFKSIVARINNMYPGGVLATPMGRYRMTGGIEALGDLETQLLTFILEANNAVISASVRREILPVGRAVLGRLELGIKADHDLYALMEEWYAYPLPQNDLLDKLFAGLAKMLAAAGLDRALAALQSGDYKSLFSASGMLCTFVGASLAVLALLKSCDMSKHDKDTLKEIESDLNADMDLFNFNFSINFDLAIFKNIFDCLKLTGFANLFTSKEFLCGLAQDTVNCASAALPNVVGSLLPTTASNCGFADMSALYGKMRDAFNTDMTPKTT